MSFNPRILTEYDQVEYLPVFPLSGLSSLQSLYIHPQIKEIFSWSSLQKLLELIQAWPAGVVPTHILSIYLDYITPHCRSLLVLFCLFRPSASPQAVLTAFSVFVS